MNGRDSLENIKRKVPGNRKQSQPGGTPPPSTSNLLEGIHLQIERMARQQEELTAHIRTLENEYDTVVNEMMTFQRNLTQQDGLMQNLIQYFVQFENGGSPLVHHGHQTLTLKPLFLRLACYYHIVCITLLAPRSCFLTGVTTLVLRRDEWGL